MDIPTLTAKAKAFRRAERAAELLRLDLNGAIGAALQSGLRQADIVRATGYTRETIRRITRDMS